MGAEVLRLVTAPTAEPLAIADVLAQVRREASFAEDNDWITARIKAARQKVEADTGLQLLTAEWELWLPGFPCWRIVLPKAPLQSVTSVTYVDENGDEQTWDAAEYLVVAPSGDRPAHGWIERAYDVVWPVTRCQADAVKVRFTAGYGNADAVPEDLRHAMLTLIAHWYQHREAVMSGTSTPVPLAYDALLVGYGGYPVLVAQ